MRSQYFSHLANQRPTKLNSLITQQQLDNGPFKFTTRATLSGKYGPNGLSLPPSNIWDTLLDIQFLAPSRAQGVKICVRFKLVQSSQSSSFGQVYLRLVSGPFKLSPSQFSQLFSQDSLSLKYFVLFLKKNIFLQERALPLTYWRLQVTPRLGSSSAGTRPPSPTPRTGSSTGNKIRISIILCQSLN